MLSSRRANAYSSFHPCRFRARATIRRCSVLGVSTGLMCQRHDVPKRENASRYSLSTSWLRQTSAISSGWFAFLVCTGSFSLPHARRAVFMFLRLSRRKTPQYSAFAGTCRMGVGAGFMLIVELSRIAMDRGDAPRRRALPVPRKPLRALVAIVLHRGRRSPGHGRARDAHAGPHSARCRDHCCRLRASRAQGARQNRTTVPDPPLMPAAEIGPGERRPVHVRQPGNGCAGRTGPGGRSSEPAV